MGKILIITDNSIRSKALIDVVLNQSSYEVYGVVKVNTDSFELDVLYKSKVVGSIKDLPVLLLKNDIIGGVIAISGNILRKEIFKKITLIDKKFKFVSVIHPSSVLGKNVEINKGVIIMPRVVINSDSIINDFCVLNSCSSLGHDGKLNKFSSLSEGVIAGGSFSLGELSSIELGVKIIENIEIGSRTIVKAGSLVLNSFKNDKIVSGIPAKVICENNYRLF
jgi:sugar O-acyltransferase (sialic acid O-acetyltransferase NeuD family)